MSRSNPWRHGAIKAGRSRIGPTAEPRGAGAGSAPELAATLGIDAAHLFAAAADGPRTVPVELGRMLLGGRDVVLRGDVRETGRLHGAASPLVRSEALLRVRGRGDSFALLVLGSREPDAFAGADAPLLLLGRAVEAALDRS